MPEDTDPDDTGDKWGGFRSVSEQMRPFLGVVVAWSGGTGASGKI